METIKSINIENSDEIKAVAKIVSYSFGYPSIEIVEASSGCEIESIEYVSPAMFLALRELLNSPEVFEHFELLIEEIVEGDLNNEQ